MKAYLGSQEIKDNIIDTVNSGGVVLISDVVQLEWFCNVARSFQDRLPLDKNKEFLLSLLDSINPGADLDSIKEEFFIFVLERIAYSFHKDEFPKVLKCVTNIIELYESGCKDLNKFERASTEAEIVSLWAEGLLKPGRSVLGPDWMHAIQEAVNAARESELIARSEFSKGKVCLKWLFSEMTIECDLLSEKFIELIRYCK